MRQAYEKRSYRPFICDSPAAEVFDAPVISDSLMRLSATSGLSNSRGGMKRVKRACSQGEGASSLTGDEEPAINPGGLD